MGGRERKGRGSRDENYWNDSEGIPMASCTHIVSICYDLISEEGERSSSENFHSTQLIHMTDTLIGIGVIRNRSHKE